MSSQVSVDTKREYQRVRTKAAAAISIPAAPTPMAVIASIYDRSAMSLTS